MKLSSCVESNRNVKKKKKRSKQHQQHQQHQQGKPHPTPSFHYYYYVYRGGEVLSDTYKEIVTHLRIADGVKEIPREAFANCKKLKQVDIAQTVQRIGTDAFLLCTKLVKVTFLSKNESKNTSCCIKEIEDCAFAGCESLLMIDIPSSVRRLGAATFTRCTALTMVNFIMENEYEYDDDDDDDDDDGEATAKSGNGNKKQKKTRHQLRKIPTEAFSQCHRLTAIINFSQLMGTCIRKIDDYAFAGCKSLNSLRFFTVVDDGCETRVSVLERIGTGAFENCTGLKRVEFAPSSASSLRVIDAYAFEGCNELMHMTIPESVKKLGLDCFYGCTNLTVTMEESTTSTHEDQHQEFPKDNTSTVVELEHHSSSCQDQIMSLDELGTDTDDESCYVTFYDCAGDGDDNDDVDEEDVEEGVFVHTIGNYDEENKDTNNDDGNFDGTEVQKEKRYDWGSNKDLLVSSSSLALTVPTSLSSSYTSSSTTSSLLCSLMVDDDDVADETNVNEYYDNLHDDDDDDDDDSSMSSIFSRDIFYDIAAA